MLRIFGHFVPTAALLLALAEVTLMSAGVYFMADLLSFHAVLLPSTQAVKLSFALSSLPIAGMLSVGLYNYDRLLISRLPVGRVLLAFTMAAPAVYLVSLAFSNNAEGEVSAWSLWYLKATIIWFGCVMVTRTFFQQIARMDLFKRRIIILGAGERAGRIRKRAASEGLCHYIPVASVGSDGKDARLSGRVRSPGTSFREDSLDARNLREVARICRAHEIVVATDDDRQDLPRADLLACKLAGVNVVDYQSFWERENGCIDLDALQSEWMIFSDGFRSGHLSVMAKRCFDIVASATMLLLTFPLLIATAITIKLESTGPVFYCQERVGLFGKKLNVMKFRSMRVDAEQNGTPQWAMKRDPRVTRVGGWIRKLRIDELPQLLNVLRGEMSFVGPRPERPYFVEQLARDIPFYDERHTVKPGITGWAQVNYPYGASQEDARRKLSYDLYYVKNRSLVLDIVTLVQTVRVILFSEGAR